MINPFEVLGLKGSATPDEIRTAYRSLVKQVHPDLIQDPTLRQETQARMVALNLAYEEALRLASARPLASASEPLSSGEAVLLARRAMTRNRPDSALRQLLRCEERDAEWYYIQGQVLMAMNQYSSAHQSFREAVRLSPDSREYREGALEAAVADRKSRTLTGRIKTLMQRIYPEKKRS